MNNCEEARRALKGWLEVPLKGQNTDPMTGNLGEAFKHIRECREEKCSFMRNKLIEAISGTEK